MSESHFYRRLNPKDVFEHILEEVRSRHNLAVAGYVIMPEHIHLLVDEPPDTPLATVLQVLKQTSSRQLKSSDEERFWLPRYYDFNVSSREKYFGEASVYPSQPGNARVGGEARRLSVE